MDMLEKLDHYLKNTPEEEILKHLEKASRFNNIGIPMDELIEFWNSERGHFGENSQIETDPPVEKLQYNKNSDYSEFFFNITP